MLILVMRLTDIVRILRECRYVLILVLRVTDIVLHWGDTRGMQIDTDIGDDSEISSYFRKILE